LNQRETKPLIAERRMSWLRLLSRGKEIESVKNALCCNLKMENFKALLRQP